MCSDFGVSSSQLLIKWADQLLKLNQSIHYESFSVYEYKYTIDVYKNCFLPWMWNLVYTCDHVFREFKECWSWMKMSLHYKISNEENGAIEASAWEALMESLNIKPNWL